MLKISVKKMIMFYFSMEEIYFTELLTLVQTRGEALLPILEKMQLDGFVPGNWEYAYGKQQLVHLTSKLPFPTIASNLKDSGTKELLFKPYIIREMGEVKVGIIGLTYPYVDITMPKEFSNGLEFSNGVDEVRECLRQLEGKVDVIVLLSHMGLPLDVKLVSLVKGIDLVLSGHSHDRVKDPIQVGNTLVVQAGSSSSFLGRLDVTLENKKIVDVQYELVRLDESLKEDLEVKGAVDDILAQFSTELSTVIGETMSILHRMTLNESPMDQLITDAYLHVMEADAAFSHGWRYSPPLDLGALTLYDLHTIIPTNPKLFTLKITGLELWNSLEKNLEQVFSSDPFEQKGGYILRSSGISMTFKPYNPKGNRIQTLQISGEDIKMEKTYTIVSGGGQLFKPFEEKKVYKELRAIDAIIAFLQENGPFEARSEANIISV